MIRCRDLYSPFGQKRTAPCDAHRVGFTGKERDGETGFDYFGARYYAPIPGRFLSPDPLLDSADPADPQSWNRYAYVRNSPLVTVDPDGRAGQVVIKGAAVVATNALIVTIAVPEQQRNEIATGIVKTFTGLKNTIPDGISSTGDLVSRSEEETPDEEDTGSFEGFPDRDLPRDPVHQDPVPETMGAAHTQLGT